MTDNTTHTPSDAPAPTPTLAPGPHINVRVNPNDSVSHRAENVVNLSDLAPARQGVLATVRRAGNPVMSGPLVDSDVIRVTLPSGAETSMTLRQAKFAGLVQVDAAEGYTLKGAQSDKPADQSAEQKEAQEAPAAREAKEAAESAQSFPISPEVAKLEEGFVKVIRSTGRNEMNLISEYIATGQTPKGLEAIARDLGAPLESVTRDFHRIAREHGIRTEAAVMVEGVPVQEMDAFWQFVARTVPRAQVNSALIRGYARGDLRPFGQWAKNYLRSAPRGSSKTVNAVVSGRVVKTTDANARRMGAQIVND